ncbi:xanthine dehydrogenase family protein molybdopterin-binding subunit [Deinococcus sp. Arct2-2]|uniref:xanthine dehydrogenase family protein molybdopterin-binding subunit n=1 Tax=Deinococcus sp. Arct2-2 TaxID=2568653 RepID=UPI0010A49C05|nr:xanthine dehydrogenase family protein molybdopterin-binding subunit [Deinococcus sp. Arct2-2]THF69575.1 xanthine dehydrogenase family protein molybdopterin-binding subunit [Deinococcus sp. Arct2-2]
MSPAVGQPIPRKEGRAKVTGRARFAAEYPIRGVVHAIPVLSTISRGRISSIDTAAAQAAPGVLAVLTHLNAPKLPYRPFERPLETSTRVGVFFKPLRDDVIRFNRQYVAVVVATTLEQAEAAAALVRVSYAPLRAISSFEEGLSAAHQPREKGSRGLPYQRGDPELAFAAAAVRVDQRYTIPTEHHNPLETHATIAVWNGNQLTLYDKSQWVKGVQQHAALAFGIPYDQVRVLSPFVGGAFGSALRPWAHIDLAAMAAQVVKRPVKLSLTREAMYGTTGFRPETRMRVRLGANASGTLTAVMHEAWGQTSTYEEYTENTLDATRLMYAVPNLSTVPRLVPMHVSTPQYMRGPGEATGMFALETALDELAVALRMDPVALRIKNEPLADPESKLPWSLRSYVQTMQLGAERFGWARRTPAVGSMKDGGLLIGMGMAGATYPALRFPTSARIRMNLSGSVTVLSAATDIGPGTYTSMAQVAADAVGLDVALVNVELADSKLPYAHAQGASALFASLSPAVREAGRQLARQLAARAVADQRSPLYGLKAETLTAVNGGLSGAGKRESYAALMARSDAPLEVHLTSAPPMSAPKQSTHCFGSHFVEVSVDPDVLEVRVRRVVSAFGVGRVVNPRTAHSQAVGGIIGGIGMALHEQTHTDPRYGRIMNANLSEYLIPVHADVPPIEAVYLDEVDYAIGPLGAKGLGELPIVGVAAAISNAVYHATGKRVRDLPITIEKLL